MLLLQGENRRSLGVIGLVQNNKKEDSGNVRMPAVADAFYSSDPDELRSMIEKFLKDADAKSPPQPLKKGEILRGIIVPHAGYVYSGPVAAYAYRLLAQADISKTIPDRFILIGPSHYAGFPGLAESGAGIWQTPLGPCATFSIRAIDKQGRINRYPAAHSPEHSLEVQLPFLQTMLEKIGRLFRIDPILTGDISPVSAADLLSDAYDDLSGDPGDSSNPAPFFIVSSDLSHYLPYDTAVKADRETLRLAESLDLEGFISGGDACGRAGIAIMIALARKKGWEIRLIKYANSGDTAGPKSDVVGYAALAIVENPKSSKGSK